jgi:hypothetical protein
MSDPVTTPIAGEAQTSASTAEHSLQDAVTPSLSNTGIDKAFTNMTHAMTATQQVLAGLSQMPSITPDHDIRSIEGKDSDTLGEVITGLSKMSAKSPKEARPLPNPQYERVRSVTAEPSRSDAFMKWGKRIFEKKRKSVSESSESATASKRPRLFHLSDDEEKRFGSVQNPMILPMEHEQPPPQEHLDHILAVAVTRYQARKKEQKSPEPPYSGIHALLDIDGRPRPFPAKVQASIKKQQKSYKTIGISHHAYDGSFAESSVNDGRGNVGEKGFSNTGSIVREALGGSIETERQDIAPGAESDERSVKGNMPMSVEQGSAATISDHDAAAIITVDIEGNALVVRGEDAVKEYLAAAPVVINDKAAAVPTAAEGSSTKTQVDDGVEAHTSAERVFGTFELLEMILLECGQIRAHSTVLRAQAVNKTFERVVQRSLNLQRMLFFKAAPLKAGKEDGAVSFEANPMLQEPGSQLTFNYPGRRWSLLYSTGNGKVNLSLECPEAIASRLINLPGGEGGSWKRMFLARGSPCMKYFYVHVARGTGKSVAEWVSLQVRAGELSSRVQKRLEGSSRSAVS